MSVTYDDILQHIAVAIELLDHAPSSGAILLAGEVLTELESRIIGEFIEHCTKEETPC